ncbi:hypothetical protein GCM10020370_32880 [Paenibacillus hodogayensis]
MQRVLASTPFRLVFFNPGVENNMSEQQGSPFRNEMGFPNIRSTYLTGVIRPDKDGTEKKPSEQ